ncbi:MAG: hypothetical protein AB7O65_04165 [Candidatus Korobacteraceae bacterium]
MLQFGFFGILKTTPDICHPERSEGSASNGYHNCTTTSIARIVLVA